jgi:hypothetical protein
MYSTNITPDADTGIGKYTLDDFDRARAAWHPVRWRFAVPRDAVSVVCAHVRRRRACALSHISCTAWRLHRRSRTRAGSAWPLSMRWPMALWRKGFAPQPDAVAFDRDRYADASVARGAYLVQGLGHCGSCHTPRALTMQEKALDESGAAYLAAGRSSTDGSR